MGAPLAMTVGRGVVGEVSIKQASCVHAQRSGNPALLPHCFHGQNKSVRQQPGRGSIFAMNRAFILRTLSLLPVWLWPVFLHDVAVYLRWRADLPDDMRGHVALAVSRHGRLIIVDVYEDAAPVRAVWRGHTPYQPWLSLSVALKPDTCVKRFRPACFISRFEISALSRSDARVPFAFDSG